jgi:bifunctional non-homologous end joining protein LigD
LLLHRFPDGIHTNGFVQHEVGKHFPDWVQTADLPRRDGEGAVRHVVCEDAATLVYLANLTAIELHIWPPTMDKPEHPDRLVIDLDPPDGTSVPTLRAIAGQVRDLDKVSLTPFVQATGGRGFHIVAPLNRSADYEVVRALAADLADHLAADHPADLTTFVAPYSLRARPGAPAATRLNQVGPEPPRTGTPFAPCRNACHARKTLWSAMGRGIAPREVRAALDNLS